MKTNVVLTEKMAYDLLDGVKYLKDELSDVNRHLDSLRDTLERLVDGGDFEKFNKADRALGVKFNAIDIGSEFIELCNQREKILRELKEVYKKVFLRAQDSDNERAIYSENRFILGQM